MTDRQRRAIAKRRIERRFGERRKATRRAKINRVITIIFAILMIIGSIAIIPLMDNNDATHCLVTIPLAILIIVVPKASDFDIFEFWEEFKEDFQRDFL